MPLPAQDLIALALVALAAAYVVRRLFRSFAPKPGAGCASGCASCPSSQGTGPDSIVPLDTLTRANGRPPVAR